MTVAGIGMKKFSRDKNIDRGNSRLNKVNNMPLGAFKVVLISYLFLTYWVTYWVTYLIRRTRRRVISDEIKDNALDCPLFLFAHLFITYRTTYSENQTAIGLPFLPMFISKVSFGLKYLEKGLFTFKRPQRQLRQYR